MNGKRPKGLPVAQSSLGCRRGASKKKAPGVRERIAPTLGRLNQWSRVGCAANFLSSRSPAQAEARVYLDPCEILELGLAITPAVRLDHSYLPNDFTLYLFREPPWEGEKVRTP